MIVGTTPKTTEDILDAADILGAAGCTDASVRGHAEGMELLVDRTAKSLPAAIKDVKTAGLRVVRVEISPFEPPVPSEVPLETTVEG